VKYQYLCLAGEKSIELGVVQDPLDQFPDIVPAIFHVPQFHNSVLESRLRLDQALWGRSATTKKGGKKHFDFQFLIFNL
jgi:hypothetical protein